MRALIVAGGGEVPDPRVLTQLAEEADLTLACDGGAAHFMAAGLVPDRVVGDFDSLAPAEVEKLRSLGSAIESHPAEKDETDLDLAIAVARVAGASESTFVGITGGTPDHTLAAFGSLCSAADLSPVVVADSWSARLLSVTGCARTTVARGSTFSVIALTGPATVDVAGSRWELDGAALAPLSSLGVGNFAETDAQVSVSAGCVLVVVRSGA